MKRREFITLLGGAAVAWPLAARAQQPERMPRIGALMAFTENDPEEKLRVNALRQGLRELGWEEGRNVQTIWRFAAVDPNLMRSYAIELVNLKPNVVVAENTSVVAAVLRETRAIPIVFVVVGDPIGSGFVASFARPGGNVTGFTNFEPSLTGKWLGLLKEISPDIRRAALLFNPATASAAGQYFLPAFEIAARSLSIEAVPSPVHKVEDIQTAVAAIASAPRGGLIVMPDTFLVPHRDLITELVSQYRLPAVYPYRYWTNNGGLASYGVNTPDILRRSASYVDRILKGEKAGDLPVQAPTKFELVINLKAAKAIGLTIPFNLLTRADEVIE